MNKKIVRILLIFIPVVMWLYGFLTFGSLDDTEKALKPSYLFYADGQQASVMPFKYGHRLISFNDTMRYIHKMDDYTKSQTLSQKNQEFLYGKNKTVLRYGNKLYILEHRKEVRYIRISRYIYDLEKDTLTKLPEEFHSEGAVYNQSTFYEGSLYFLSLDRERNVRLHKWNETEDEMLEIPEIAIGRKTLIGFNIAKDSLNFNLPYLQIYEDDKNFTTYSPNEDFTALKKIEKDPLEYYFQSKKLADDFKERARWGELINVVFFKEDYVVSERFETLRYKRNGTGEAMEIGKDYRSTSMNPDFIIQSLDPFVPNYNAEEAKIRDDFFREQYRTYEDNKREVLKAKKLTVGKLLRYIPSVPSLINIFNLGLMVFLTSKKTTREEVR
ncbi:hypothetical protein [Guggenheimella bovis]